MKFNFSGNCVDVKIIFKIIFLVFCFARFGFVPNGARVYYTRRSQPPFLIPMFEKYYDATHDLDFLRKSIDRLEEEYDFWMKNRTVDVDIGGTTYTLNGYAVDMQMPRYTLCILLMWIYNIFVFIQK